MYAKGQREIIVFGYAVAVAVLLCIIGYVSSGGCGRAGTDATGNNGECTAQQIKRVEEYNQQSRAEVESAAGAVGRAEQHADRAAELNQSAQVGAGDSKKLVEQIRADNERAKQIVDELIGEN